MFKLTKREINATIALVGMFIIGALMGFEIVSPAAGLPILVAILAGTGVYEYRQRSK